MKFINTGALVLTCILEMAAQQEPKHTYGPDNISKMCIVKSQSVVESNLAFERPFQFAFSCEFVHPSKMQHSCKQDHEQDTLRGKGRSEA